MNVNQNLEDTRGVDVSQIQTLLKLTVAERVARMVTTANMIKEIRERVHKGRAEKDS